MFLDEIELTMDVSNELPCESIGLGVEEKIEDVVFLLEDGGLSQFFGAYVQKRGESIFHVKNDNIA